MPISDDVRRFILMNISSVPYLEAIILLRSNSEHIWNIGEMGSRLFINNSTATAIFKQLQESEIIMITNEESSLFKYQPKTDELKTMLDQVAETYKTNLIEVTNLIHSNINKKAQNFANAFRWRKDS